MLTFEQYFSRTCVYRRDDSKYIDNSIEFNLAELLASLDLKDVDYNYVWLEAEYDGYDINVSFRKPESDEEFEQRKVKMYNDYVQGEGARQQREIEEYKRLKLKYEGV